VFRISRIVSKLNRSARETQMKLAVLDVFRFSLRVIRGNKTDSKLCASLTRHATGGSPRLPAGGSTGKGGCAPRCIPLHRTGEAGSHA